MARPLKDQEPFPPGEFVATIEAARSAPGSDIRFAAPADASETAPEPRKFKTVPHAFCCSSTPSICDCVRPDHGTALQEIFMNKTNTKTPITDALQDAFTNDDNADRIGAYCEMADHARKMELALKQARGAIHYQKRLLAKCHSTLNASVYDMNMIIVNHNLVKFATECWEAAQ